MDWLTALDPNFTAGDFSWSVACVVALAGGIGACIRYLVTRANLLCEFLSKRFKNPSRSKLFTRLNALSLGTLTANIIGCTLIAYSHSITTSYFPADSPSASILYTVLTAGLCGGISTLSTFTAEIAALWCSKCYRACLLYTTLTVILPAAGAMSQIVAA